MDIKKLTETPVLDKSEILASGLINDRQGAMMIHHVVPNPPKIEKQEYVKKLTEFLQALKTEFELDGKVFNDYGFKRIMEAFESAWQHCVEEKKVGMFFSGSITPHKYATITTDNSLWSYIGVFNIGEINCKPNAEAVEASEMQTLQILEVPFVMNGVVCNFGSIPTAAFMGILGREKE